jgi:hypothetical protein
MNAPTLQPGAEPATVKRCCVAVLLRLRTQLKQPAYSRLGTPSPLDSGPAPCEISAANVGLVLTVCKGRVVETKLVARPFLLFARRRRRNTRVIK